MINLKYQQKITFLQFLESFKNEFYFLWIAPFLMFNENGVFSWKWKNLHNKWKAILPKDIFGGSSLGLLLTCIYDNTFLKVQSYASVAATCTVLFDNQIFYSASNNMITSHYWHAKFQTQVYLVFEWSLWGEKCSYHYFSQFRRSMVFHLLIVQNT